MKELTLNNVEWFDYINFINTQEEFKPKLSEQEWENLVKLLELYKQEKRKQRRKHS